MKVYLAKFILNGSVAYKIGHTKWFNAIKRFDDPQYNIFDSVSIMVDINIQHDDPRVARLISACVEATLQAIYPKNFMLEEHFNMPENAFDGLSGITEMFVLNANQSEETLVNMFERAAKNIFKTMKNSKEYVSV